MHGILQNLQGATLPVMPFNSNYPSILGVLNAIKQAGMAFANINISSLKQTTPIQMKKETRILGRPPGGIVMLLLSCAAMAANGATIMQTREFSFLPHAVRTLAIDKFDNDGGGSTLTGVHITTQYTRGGRHAAYNESESSATITLTESDTLIIDALEILEQTSEFDADNDPVDLNFHRSNFRYELPNVTGSYSAYMENRSPFIGTDPFELELEGSQHDQSQLMSDKYRGTMVSYPDLEPPAMVCMTVVWALFIRRRSH